MHCHSAVVLYGVLRQGIAGRCGVVPEFGSDFQSGARVYHGKLWTLGEETDPINKRIRTLACCATATGGCFNLYGGETRA